MFRLATNADLVQLKMLGPGDIFPENKALEWKWGLKSFGYMFILNEIKKRNANIVLEAGMGLGSILYDRFNGEFIGVDKAGFYEKEKFLEARSKTPKMKFIDGFVGDFNPEIKDKSVDLTCSVSVLEHVPVGNIEKTIEDFARITKPGGAFVHTLDVGRNDKQIWETYFPSIKEHFLVDDKDINFDRDGLLYEPLSIVFSSYEKRNEHEYKSSAVSKNQCTIVICATKPQ